MKIHSFRKIFICAAFIFSWTIATNANAIFITTTSNGSWDVTALESAPFSANQALLESQFWWGSSTLAQEVAELVGDSLGLPNFSNSETPYYAYAIPYNEGISVWKCTTGCSSSVTLHAHQSAIYSYAIATQATVPEPSILALLSLGLVGIGFTRRKMKI